MADNASSNLPSLTVLGGDKAGTRFVLDEPVDNILVGSDPSCRFCIALAGVSPVHARIWVDDTGITVYDTNSPRGLYVNDERVATQVRLRNGDVIWLGPPGDEQSVMIQCRVPSKEARPELTPAQPAIEETAAEPGATSPLVVPEGGYSAATETVAMPPAMASSTPLPPPASLLPPPALPARNEFEDDMGEATVPMAQARAATPASAATPAPVSAPPPARPQSLTPRPQAPSHAPPAPHPGMTPAPARPASLTPVPRTPGGRPAAHRPASPAHASANAPRRSGRKGMVVAIGLVGLVVLGAVVAGGLYLFRDRLVRMVRTTPSPVATAPAVAAPTPAGAPVAETTPAATPSAEATAPPTPVEVVIPVKPSTPAPTSTPGKTPTPAKTPTPGKTPTPAKIPAATATASAEALRAQQQAAQVNGLVAQAEAAYSSQRFEAAIGFYDEALRIDPREARATAGHQAATAAAFCWKRSFVPGRTVVKSARGGSDSNLQGFESTDVKVARAPDYSGLVEFVVSPARVKPGDGYSVRVSLTNDGKKAFRITSATVTAVVNGERSPVPTTPPAGDVAPRQAGALAQLGGSWLESTRSWTLEVTVSTAHGEAFSNQVSWR
jgi:hypothetical protein